jgi:hypothetical protein
MTKLLGPALAFYVQHFDEAEALREMSERPQGITWPEWQNVRQVVKYQADSEAASAIQRIMDSDIVEAIGKANRFDLGQNVGERYIKNHWALTRSIGEIDHGPECLQLGIAIDGDEKIGPWLGIFLNYLRQRTTMLRRAATALTNRKIEYVEMVDAYQGWTGQLILGRFALHPDSNRSDCSLWAEKICNTVLVEMWSDLAMPMSDSL